MLQTSSVKHRHIEYPHHKILHRILIKDIRDQFNPLRFRLTVDRRIAIVPVFRVPASQVPINNRYLIIVTPIFTHPLLFNHDVLGLEIRMGEDNPMSFECTFNRFIKQADIMPRLPLSQAFQDTLVEPLLIVKGTRYTRVTIKSRENTLVVRCAVQVPKVSLRRNTSQFIKCFLDTLADPFPLVLRKRWR